MRVLKRYKKYKNIKFALFEIITLFIFLFLFFSKIKLSDFYHIRIFSIDKIVILLFIQFLLFLFWTMGWFLLLRIFYKDISFWNTLRAKLSNYAISMITPFVGIGGDLVIPLLIKKQHHKFSKIYATIMTERFFEGGSFIIVISFASIFFFKTQKNSSLRTLMVFSIIISLSLIIYLIFIILKRKKIFTDFFKWISKIFHIDRFYWFKSVEKFFEDFENELFMMFKKEHTKYIVGAIIFKFISSIVDILKIAAVLYAMGYKKNIIINSTIIISSYLVIWFFSFIPAALGGFEYISLMVFESLHYSRSDGLTYIITIRAISLLTVALGIINYLITRSQKKFSLK